MLDRSKPAEPTSPPAQWIPEGVRIRDISPVLSPRLAVYPGDQPFSRREDLSWQRGDDLQLSSITTSLHLGAHADAPRHYHPSGAAMDQVRLSTYLGSCQVVHLPLPPRSQISPRHLKEAGVAVEAPRVLFRTDSFPDPERWRDDFVTLDPSLVDFLAAAKVRLVGIDTPSVDGSCEHDLPSHRRLLARGLANLEGLDLRGVPPGLYTLVALPLRIEAGDGSPVRAVLLG